MQWRHHVFRTRSSGGPSTGGGHMELFIWRISWDSVGFRVRSCGFRYGCSNLQLSSLVTVIAIVCNMTTFCLSTITNSTTTSFARLRWWRSEDSGTPLALQLSLDIARRSNDVFVIFATFGTLCTVVEQTTLCLRSFVSGEWRGLVWEKPFVWSFHGTSVFVATFVQLIPHEGGELNKYRSSPMTSDGYGTLVDTLWAPKWWRPLAEYRDTQAQY
jgi:hypothetical protein